MSHRIEARRRPRAKRGEWGEILTISLGVAQLSCVHRLPNASQEDFYDEVFQVMHAEDTIPWIGIGDWNHTPDENPCASVTNLVAAIRMGRAMRLPVGAVAGA